jgi:hypothetical protein
MRIRNKKTYYIKEKAVITDNEGGKYDGYSEPKEFKACIYPASGKLQVEMYGERLKYILNALCDEPYTIEVKGKVLFYITKSGAKFCEGAGVCVYVPQDAEPDYKIISIKPCGHLVMELEKL